MVAKSNGHEALVLLIEHDHGYHSFSTNELNYLKRQYQQWYKSMRTKGMTQGEASEIIQRVIDSTKHILTHDIHEEFFFTASREDGLFEIDILMANSQKSTLERFEEDEEAEAKWLAKMDAKIERFEEKKDGSYWNGERHHSELMDTVLTSVESRYPDEGPVNKEDTEFLQYLTFKLRRLRGLYKPWECTKNQWINGKFVRVQTLKSLAGDGIWMTYKHWASFQNRINRLLGIEKRHVINTKVETEEETIEERGLIVYGFNMDWIADSKVSEESEE